MGITYGTSTLFQATKGIVQDGLVLNLDAGVNKSYPRNGTTWYDLSNNGNATLANSPTFDRDNGGNIILDGSNDAITISALTFSPTGFTYSFTAKFGTSQSVGYPRIIAGGADIEWWIGGPHALRWRWAGGDPSVINSNANYFIQDAIHIYTITYTSPNLTIYRDGSLFQTMTYTSSTSTNFNALMNKSNYSRPLGGNIYQCLLYNKTLTATEVLQNYNATKARFGL